VVRIETVHSAVAAVYGRRSNGNGFGVHLPPRRRKIRHTAQIAQNDGEKKAPGTDPGAVHYFIFFAISDSTVNGTRITANNIYIIALSPVRSMRAYDAFAAQVLHKIL
jgi:hypothetical protein